MDIEGKTAVVTGAGAGIGRALAEHLGRAGHEVVGVDRDAAAAATATGELAAAGVRASFRNADLSDPAAVERLLDELGGEPFDVLVQTAGISCVGAFAATGTRGARLGYTLAPFLSGVGYPDYVVFTSAVLGEGDGGVRAAGWFDAAWGLER